MSTPAGLRLPPAPTNRHTPPGGAAVVNNDDSFQTPTGTNYFEAHPPSTQPLPNLASPASSATAVPVLLPTQPQPLYSASAYPANWRSAAQASNNENPKFPEL